MTLDPELRELLAPMVERDVRLGDAAFTVDRARVVARMARPAPPERRAWRAPVMLAVAAALALVVGARVRPRRAALDIAVLEGTATRAAGALETAAGSKARVRTSEGLEIELRGHTRVALDELETSSHQVRLLGGAIRCTIPHRAEPRVFRVVTADVTVVDLGTVFTVRVDEGATRVSVEEGEVLVRHGAQETRVQAPRTWSNAPDAPVVPSAEAPRAPAPALPAPSAKAGHAVRPTRVEAPPAGTLAEEAQLLRAGLAAERQGRPTEALAALRQLLDEHPQSPLAADARAALVRVEAGTRQ